MVNVKEVLDRHIHHSNVKLRGVFASLILYYILAVAVYMPGEDWGAGDCLYFATVVATTVGYGDLYPTKPPTKWFTIFYVHFALSIVCLALSIVQDIFTEIFTTSAMQQEVGLFDTDLKKKRRRKRAIAIVGLYLSFLIVGGVVFSFMFNNDDEYNAKPGRKTPVLDGFYFSVITLTTIGFGDHSPMMGGSGAMAYGCFFMLFGIPACGAALSSLNSALYPIADPPETLQKVRAANFNTDTFASMEQFVDHLRSEGIGNYRDQGQGKISRFEFLSFILVQNGVVEVQNIKNVMTNFDKLDALNEGFISQHDVDALQGKGFRCMHRKDHEICDDCKAKLALHEQREKQKLTDPSDAPGKTTEHSI
mmetsp:Transcript_95058/g.182684  ORF Transcript_95058/g.182684 Transcript_95058/m.182684 type:complete len:364 (-) Transcript_95058:218-1309(-)